ncbi:formate dehydrogenase subunit delta [Inquilinus limosus]|uniref:formate dehydrogenase subunit delta n=1 Tax=Inquilinus limosus TaxID=171674 RepID=UPI000408017C|nr:formate dehydrogenase subunit delta [Inquilinus limosus]
MSADKITRMANQIAGFFAAYPKEEAVAGVRKHIQDFWEPRMKEQIRAKVAAKDVELNPLVVEAVETLPH